METRWDTSGIWSNAVNASYCWAGPKSTTKQVLNSELFNFNSLPTNAPVVVTSQRARGWESWDRFFTLMHTQPLDCYFWRDQSFIIIIGNLSTRSSWYTNGMHGWPRRTGSGTRFARQMQKQYNVKPSRTPTEWFSWKCFSKICVKFCFLHTSEGNMISDEEFLLLYDEYSSKNPEFEPLVSTWELAFWSPWPQLKNVLTCAVAVMLQKYFRLTSVVPITFGA